MSVAPISAVNVDADREALHASSRILRAAGLSVCETDPRQLALALTRAAPDLLVLGTRVDRHLVDELCHAVQSGRQQAIPVLQLTANGQAPRSGRFPAQGRCARLCWPTSVEVARATVRALLRLDQTSTGALDAASGLTAAASCQVDIGGRVLEWNHAAEKRFGWTAGEAVGRMLPIVTEADQASLLALLARAANGQPARRSQVVCRTRSGARAVIDLSLVPITDGAENVTQVQVIATDDIGTSHLPDDLRHLSATLLASPDFVYVIDGGGAAHFVNPAARQLSGLDPGDPPAALDLRQIVSSASRRRLLQVVLPRAIRDGICQSELVFVAAHGQQVPASVQAIRLRADGDERVALVARDISAHKKAEARLQRLNRTSQVLSRSAQLIREASDEAVMLNEICRLLTETDSYRFALASRLDTDEEGKLIPMAWSGDDEVVAGDLVTWWVANTPRGHGPIGSAVRTGKAIVRHNLGRPRHSPCAALKKRLGLRAMVALPLISGAHCLGALSVYSSRPEMFDAEEVSLLQDLARQLAHALQALRERLARREAETSLRLLAAAFDSTQEGIMITDAICPDHPIVYLNAAVTRIFGWEAGELIGRSGRLLAEGEMHQQEMDVIRRALRGRTTGQAVLRCYRKDGQPFWSEVRVAPIREAAEGEVTHYVSLISDVTRRVHHEDQLAHLATHDLLTGLANRTLLHDRLRQGLVQAERYGKLVAILLFDLDNFQQVNERAGRRIGDLLLQAIARRLTGVAQERDTIARLGGDEFVLLLVDRDQPPQVTSAAAMLLETLAKPLWIDNEEFLITPSVGAAVYPTDTTDAEELLRLADIAMSAAKAAGRNVFRLYSPHMLLHWQRQTELTVDLRRALERKELVLHYQPKADLYSGNCTGVEALVRWQHPERGLIPPGDFIPLAEASGQIVAVGRWVLQEACREIVRWHALGMPPLRMAVNLSPQQLGDGNLLADIAAALETSGATARQLELEITESTVMENPEAAARVLRGLRGMGVRLAMDDFGTGHSSLGNLRRFPFDVLKIDRSFVQNVTSEPEDATIATAVIAMAHSLGMKVIAEGVESESQTHWLRTHLCDEIQGYYLSPPLPGDRIMPLLRNPLPPLAILSERSRPQRTLLIVDDEPDILQALKRLLRRSGYRILATTSAVQAFELLAANPVQVIVSDQRMPAMGGAEFLSRARALYPDTIRIMLTGYSEPDAMSDAINRAAVSKFLTKPWDDEELRRVIHEAFVAYDHSVARGGALAAPGSLHEP